MKHMTRIAAALAIGLIIALASYGRQLDLGHALDAAGCRRTLYIPTSDVSARRLATFNAEAPFDGVNPAQFASRYGVALSAVKGNTVGERYSRDGLLDWIGSGALGLSLPYSATPQDDSDAKFVSCDGQRAVWDSMISPPVGPPQPTPTPAPPPVPAPAPPPAGARTLRAQQIACPGDATRSTAQVCIEIYEVQR